MEVQGFLTLYAADCVDLLGASAAAVPIRCNYFVDGGGGHDATSFETGGVSAGVALIDGTSVHGTETTGTPGLRKTETLTFCAEVFRLFDVTTGADTFDFAASSDLIMAGAGTDDRNTEPRGALPNTGCILTDANGFAGACVWFQVGLTLCLKGVGVNALTKARLPVVPL